jgi:hypothetical protein
MVGIVGEPLAVIGREGAQLAEPHVGQQLRHQPRHRSPAACQSGYRRPMPQPSPNWSAVSCAREPTAVTEAVEAAPGP